MLIYFVNKPLGTEAYLLSILNSYGFFFEESSFKLIFCMQLLVTYSTNYKPYSEQNICKQLLITKELHQASTEERVTVSNTEGTTSHLDNGFSD